MITVSDAFWKFRGRLETTDTEDAAASQRQQKLRGQLDEAFDIVTDFLTGAYPARSLRRSGRPSPPITAPPGCAPTGVPSGSTSASSTLMT